MYSSFDVQYKYKVGTNEDEQGTTLVLVSYS